jgi:hypothetical protein
MTMTVHWRRVLECIDEATPSKASEINGRYLKAWTIGSSTDWITRHAMPSFERSGYVARVKGSRPRQWIRTPEGTAAISNALTALHQSAKDRLLENFKSHGLDPFFPDDSTAHTYEAQREAIHLGWIAVVRYPSPKVSITDAGHAALPSS